jgi:hypothetical protein
VEDAQTARLQLRLAQEVVCGSVGVTIAVDLNCETGSMTEEVDDIGTNRYLPSDFPAAQTTRPQRSPKNSLRTGQVAAELAGARLHVLGKRRFLISMGHTRQFTLSPWERVAEGRERGAFR